MSEIFEQILSAVGTSRSNPAVGALLANLGAPSFLCEHQLKSMNFYFGMGLVLGFVDDLFEIAIWNLGVEKPKNQIEQYSRTLPDWIGDSDTRESVSSKLEVYRHVVREDIGAERNQISYVDLFYFRSKVLEFRSNLYSGEIFTMSVAASEAAFSFNQEGPASEARQHPPTTCSFCLAPQTFRKRMLSSPDNRTNICGSCVKDFGNFLNDSSFPESSSPEQKCSFCSEPIAGQKHMGGRKGAICERCILNAGTIIGSRSIPI